ncbi:MAG: lipopolysaccharide biosynthesis protein [Planctomycetota bacterium]
MSAADAAQPEIPEESAASNDLPAEEPYVADHPALCVKHAAGELRQRSLKGGMFTGGSQGAAFFLQLGSTITLARLLEPADFGLLGMILAFTGLFMVFQDMGLSEATVQRERISHAQVSALFFINTTIGLGLTLLFAALTPAIVWLYDEPRLYWLIPAMSAVFVLAGLSAQHMALLKRQLRFGALAAVQLAATASGIGTGVVLAVLGFGVWSLVAISVTTATVIMLLSWRLSGWRPGRPRRGTEVLGLVKFGADITIANVVIFFARNADNILIGKFLGAGVLGLYTKAYGLLLLPQRQLTRPLGAVAVPALSRLQTQPERFRRYYLRVTGIIAYATVPGIAVMGMFSAEIIAVALGPGWEGAADIFRWLAVAALLQPVLASGAWVLQALGHSARLRNLGLWTAPLYVISFAIGIPWGAEGVAASYAAMVTVLFVPSMAVALKLGPISLWDLLRLLGGPLAAAAVCVILVWVGKSTLDAGPFVSILVLVPVGLAAGVGLTALVLPAVRRDLAEMWALVSELLPERVLRVLPFGRSARPSAMDTGVPEV